MRRRRWAIEEHDVQAGTSQLGRAYMSKRWAKRVARILNEAERSFIADHPSRSGPFLNDRHFRAVPMREES